MKVREFVTKLIQAKDLDAEMYFVDGSGDKQLLSSVFVNYVRFNSNFYNVKRFASDYNLTPEQWEEVKRNGNPVVILE